MKLEPTCNPPAFCNAARINIEAGMVKLEFIYADANTDTAQVVGSPVIMTPDQAKSLLDLIQTHLRKNGLIPPTGEMH